MKTVNTKQVLKKMDGKEMTTTEDNVVVPVHIGKVIANVMAGKVSNPEWGWQLGKKFATQDKVDLKAEEIVFIKQEILACAKPDKWMTSEIAGQIIEILDAKGEEKSK